MEGRGGGGSCSKCNLSASSSVGKGAAATHSLSQSRPGGLISADIGDERPAPSCGVEIGGEGKTVGSPMRADGDGGGVEERRSAQVPPSSQLNSHGLGSKGCI